MIQHFLYWEQPELATGQNCIPALLLKVPLFSVFHPQIDRSSHPTVAMANQSYKKRDRTKENFAKSCKSGAARLNKLNRKYNAHIYLQVQWKGRYYEYNSQKDPRWLRIGDDLKTVYPLPVQWTPATFMEGNDETPPGVDLKKSNRSGAVEVTTEGSTLDVSS